jgi:hypothetical protein
MADVFQVSNGQPGNFDEGEGEIDLVVNGSKKGKVRPSAGQTLGAFLKEKASYYGVKTFSAFADGRKLDTADAAKPLTGIKSVEIVAKDARGLTLRNLARIKKQMTDAFYNFSTDLL